MKITKRNRNYKNYNKNIIKYNKFYKHQSRKIIILSQKQHILFNPLINIYDLNQDHTSFGNVAFPLWIIPTITPNKPNALPNIYTTNIFTNVYGVCASDIAHTAPVIPTHIPHTKLEKPTDTPVQNIANPSYSNYCLFNGVIFAQFILPCKIIAIITPYIATA